MRQIFLPSLTTIMMLIWLFAFAVPIIGHQKDYPASVHKTLYLDRYMDEFEAGQVVQAALEWHEATGGLVTFDVERLPQSGINPASSIIILEVSPDYPEIILLDNINQNTTLGYFNNDNGLGLVALVTSRLTEDDFKAVVLHELGHALGLEHNKGQEGIGTLMYPTIDTGANYITDTDVFHFCELYKCDPKKLKH